MVFLRKDHIKALNAQLEVFGLQDFFHKKDQVTQEDDMLFLDKEPVFFYRIVDGERMLIPCLKLLLKRKFLKDIVVDMPAVPYMIKGADVMRPGIVQFDPEIKKGEIVAIVDEKNKKPIAVGMSLLSADELAKASKGKVIKNLHYVGDEVWSIR